MTAKTPLGGRKQKQTGVDVEEKYDPAPTPYRTEFVSPQIIRPFSCAKVLCTGSDDHHEALPFRPHLVTLSRNFVSVDELGSEDQTERIISPVMEKAGESEAPGIGKAM